MAEVPTALDRKIRALTNRWVIENRELLRLTKALDAAKGLADIAIIRAQWDVQRALVSHLDEWTRVAENERRQSLQRREAND